MKKLFDVWLLITEWSCWKCVQAVVISYELIVSFWHNIVLIEIKKVHVIYENFKQKDI